MQQATKTAASAVILFIMAITCFAQSASNITGNWKSEDADKPMQMEIYRDADGKYYSKVINDNSTASKNGAVVLKALQYDDKSKTYKGAMTPPDMNMELNVTLYPENNDRIKVVAKKMLMSKTIYLSRIK